MKQNQNQDYKLYKEGVSICKLGGGDFIPPGGWRSGGYIEIPPGGWRSNFKGGWLTPSSFHKTKTHTSSSVRLSLSRIPYSFSKTKNQIIVTPESAYFHCIPIQSIYVYKTIIGNGCFKFCFSSIGYLIGGNSSYYDIQIHIVAMPKLSDCIISSFTGVVGGENLKPFIINTISEAKKIAAEWCELTMKKTYMTHLLSA